MPRTAREKSSSGIYHIMLRGINKQDIFHDEEDRFRFIQTFKKYKPICGYEIYGYCLMNNHVHLLLKEGEETIAQIMKRIGASYVYWYNIKYERCGHLFQDRYKSECVEDDRYLLTVLRYIHQNPIRAKMVKKIEEYKWSSYMEYITEKEIIVDKDFILGIINIDLRKSLQSFKEFMIKENKDQCLEDTMKSKKQFTDEQAKQLILQLFEIDNFDILHGMDRNKRNKIIKELKGKEFSIRQLSRITGLGRGLIERA